MAYSQLVILTAESDYLKRLNEIAPNAVQGITQPELDAATKAAQDSVLIEMANIGFDITAWTSQANTPFPVIEVIKLLASARVWHRMLAQYAKDIDFGSTYGATLFNAANRELNNIEKARALINPVTGAVLRPTVAQEGRGMPKMRSDQLGIRPALKAVTTDSINRFVTEHGPDLETRYQDDDFLRL